MTEEDLYVLDQAAKAIGGGSYAEMNKYSTMHSDGDSWNPLTDDGDALRLLAKMPSLWSLSLKFGTPTIEMAVAWGTGRGIVASQRAGQYEDRAKAIRYAIVRAAAEIGKKLP